MESFDHEAGQEEQGAVSLVVDPAKAFERVQVAVVWRCAMYFRCPQGECRFLCRYFAQKRRLRYEDGRSERRKRVQLFKQARKWSLVPTVIHEATTKVFQLHLEVGVGVFVQSCS